MTTEPIPQVSALSPEEELSVQAALAQSILLTLGAERDPRMLLSDDLEARFQQRQRQLTRKVALGKQLWRAACGNLPEIENRSLHDTLRSIGQGWNRYDFRFFAHEFPCDIDYQLCRPVPETLSGVDYVNEYLRRLCVEQAFLRRFDPAAAVAVLKASCSDYRGLLINLYEPIAVNALGLALLDCDPRPLSIAPAQRERLLGQLAPLSQQRLAEQLAEGTACLCGWLALGGGAERRYLEATAQNLLPRLQAALDAGDLDAVFLGA